MYNESLPPRVGRVTWINFQPRHPGRWQSLASPGPEYCIEFWRLVSPAVSLIQRLIYHFTIWASEILDLTQTGNHDPVHPDAAPHKPKVSLSSLPADPHNIRSGPTVAICRIEIISVPPADKLLQRTMGEAAGHYKIP